MNMKNLYTRGATEIGEMAADTPALDSRGVNMSPALVSWGNKQKYQPWSAGAHAEVR